MASSGRYSVIETPMGWRVVEANGAGERVLEKNYTSQGAAQNRANTLTAKWLLMNATKAVRKRARDRCECMGECDREHRTRCHLRAGETGRIPGGAVVLSVVHLNHKTADMREDNLRVYCQLCRLHHTAAATGDVPLFGTNELTRED